MTEEKTYDILDKKESKGETAIKLSYFGIGGTLLVIFADLGSVALGIKDATSLPSEIHSLGVAIPTTLLGYIIAKKNI